MEWKTILYFFISFILFLIIWHFLVIIFNVNQILFPTPISVFYSFKDSKEIFSDILISLYRIFFGVLGGFILGIIFGIFTGKIKIINETIGQIANFFRFIPRLALVPLFLVWFGIGEGAKIFTLMWTIFFPVWISTHNGIWNLEKKYLLVAKSLNVKKLFLFRDILVKGSLGYILNGARIGVDFAFSVLIVAEMLGAYSGLGYRIFHLQSVYRIDRMVGYILTLGALGFIVDRLVLKLAKKLTPWKNEG